MARAYPNSSLARVASEDAKRRSRSASKSASMRLSSSACRSCISRKAADCSSVDGQDDVAKHQPGSVRRTAGLDGDDEQTELLAIVERAGQCLRQPNALGADAKIPAADPTMLK